LSRKKPLTLVSDASEALLLLAEGLPELLDELCYSLIKQEKMAKKILECLDLRLWS